MRPPVLAFLAASAVLIAAGCGTVGRVPQGGDVATGKLLFQQHCAACHTLAEAGAKGTVGPNLDDAIAGPRQQGFDASTLRDMVRGQIAYATLPMPRNLVSGVQADDVAAYVVQVAGNPGASVKAAPSQTTQQTTTTTPKPAPKPSGGGASGAAATRGKAVFVADCGTCHTLAAAGTKGTVGPDLDQLKPDKARVVKQVENGGKIMPAFKAQLSAQQIQDVATYVSSVAGK